MVGTKYVQATVWPEMEQWDYTNWQPLSLEELARLLKDLEIDWWLAGGYAIELFVGESFRSHGDIDILIKRDDQLKLQSHLADWQLFWASLPGLKPWLQGEFLKGKYRDIWCRSNAESPWQLQVMLFDTIGDQWLYKRDTQIRGFLSAMSHQGPLGIQYLAPEIQLLYKAKLPILPKDQLDFSKAAPLLDPSAKHWLKTQLAHCFPAGHQWLNALVQLDNIQEE